MSQSALVELSRWQWALTASFHMTFPAVTVGTSVFLIVCYGAYMRTKQAVYLRMFRFWRRIFGIGFALGVVSGIVLTFEFGLNWGRFRARRRSDRRSDRRHGSGDRLLPGGSIPRAPRLR